MSWRHQNNWKTEDTMRLRQGVALLLVGLLLTACNLGETVTPTEETIVTDTPQATGRPEVTIISPDTGDSYEVGDQVLVSVEATDAVGVTRLQMFANGQIVKNVSSESLAGERQFDAVLDYMPRTTGQVTLRVLAFRGALASDPAEITVNVVSATQPTATPGGTTGGGNSRPTIPDDGVCRVLTNVGINFRSEPTTTRDNVITVLPGGTLVPVIGRLGDNSWWQVNYNGRSGWLSGNPQFTELYGNCGTVPVRNVVINTPIPTLSPIPTATPTRTPTPTPTFTVTPVGPADLIIPTIVLSNNNSDENDRVVIPADETEIDITVAVSVMNNGSQASGSFDVELRFDGTTYDMGRVGGLNPGESILLTRIITVDTPGEYDVRVQVDTNSEVTEQSEVNNIGILPIVVEQEPASLSVPDDSISNF
jgi:uncharacterized protein YraI